MVAPGFGVSPLGQVNKYLGCDCANMQLRVGRDLRVRDVAAYAESNVWAQAKETSASAVSNNVGDLCFHFISRSSKSSDYTV